MRRVFRLALAAGVFCASCEIADAATATATLGVSMNISAECVFRSSTSQLAFGTRGALTSDIDVNATLDVQCTSMTPYTIGLSEGMGVGATVAARTMSSGAGSIRYAIFRDAGRTMVWGKTPGTDTFSGTGTGSPQSIPVYGRVFAQTTPAPGNYTDTVTVTIDY